MVDISVIKSAIERVHLRMEENRDYLIELDSAMGDGDLGLTMSKSFSAAHHYMQDIDDDDIGQVLARVGMVMAKAAPSTMGTLVATGFMRGGKALKGETSLLPTHVALFFRAFSDGLMERGKSRPGEKTAVDVIEPAANAMETATDEWRSLIESGLAAARKGLEGTTAMKAVHGRAGYYQEQSVGKEDPGATAPLLIVEGVLSAIDDAVS